MRLLILGLTAFLFSGTALAHEFKASSLTIVHPYVREMPPRAEVGAGYMKIINDSDRDDYLIGIESKVAARIELHQSKSEGGIARMRALKGGLAIPAGKTVSLGDDGTHAMFFGPEPPFKTGQEIDAVLIFKNAGRVNVVFQVEKIGAETPEQASHHGR